MSKIEFFNYIIGFIFLIPGNLMDDIETMLYGIGFMLFVYFSEKWSEDLE